MTPAKTDPMTLIVLSVSLHCHAQDFRFQSVRMWFAFAEDDCSGAPNKEAAAPEVVAYAPFVAPQSWNPSDEGIESTTGTNAAIGVEYYAKGNFERKNEVKQSFTRTHFDRGSADWMVDEDQRTNGVNWYCEQNDLKK
jgi:hypothetical protein